MKWSYRVARVAGIDVRIHATFLLLLAWFGFTNYGAGGWPAAVYGVAFILLLFVCVLLHEFGHAFAARAYGIRTPDITLLPIGGVARLERMPENPIQELVVAVAGPAVNVAIAAVLWVALGTPTSPKDLTDFASPRAGLVAQLMSVNIVLILFNMIPAFPMDGGRVLRALLATRLDHAKATRIAARIGQGIAVLFAVGGVASGNPFLFLIAVFVFMGAQQETTYATMKAAVAGMRVADAMITRFVSLPRNASVAEAAEEALRDTQPVYPITDGALRITGIVFRNRLIEAARENGAENRPVAAIAEATPAVGPEASFEEAFRVMRDNGAPVLPVVNPGGQIVGLVSLNLLSERSRLRR